MDKIAPVAVHAMPLLEKHPTALCLILGVQLMVLAQLMGAVSKLTLPLVRAEPELHELLTQLRFLLVCSGAYVPW